MAGAGLLPLAVPAQLTHRNAEELRQPAHCGRGRRRHVIRHEPQPRQRAQLHRRAQHVATRTELPQERLVSPGQRVVPDQLHPTDLREGPQLRQLILGEHIPSRHRPTTQASTAAGPRARGELPAQQAGPLAHAVNAESAAALARFFGGRRAGQAIRPTRRGW